MRGAIGLKAQIYKRQNPTSRNYGDWDNLGKTICDALNGICYDDDSRIVSAQVELFRGAPLVEILLEEVS